MFSNSTLRAIFDNTTGHCHFCGDTVVFEKYAWKDLYDLAGAWEVDHIIQRSKGGSNDPQNCLPACTRCNRLRWHRKGKDLRELILLGLVAKDEVKKNSEIGKMLKRLKSKRIQSNERRRRNG